MNCVFTENTRNACLLPYRKDKQLSWVMPNLDVDFPTSFSAVSSLHGERVNLLSTQPITVSPDMVLNAGVVLLLKEKQSL